MRKKYDCAMYKAPFFVHEAFPAEAEMLFLVTMLCVVTR